MNDAPATHGDGFQPDFNRSFRITPASVPLSSDGGAIFLREIEKRLGFIEDLAKRIIDTRCPEACRYSMAELLRTRLLLIAMGYQAQDDADALRHDPALAAAAFSGRGPDAIERPLASQPTMSRLIDILSLHHNRRALLDAPLDLALRAFPLRRDCRHRYLTVDFDSTDHPTYGHQQGANYNGHYGNTCYHSLMGTIFETQDLCGAWLRKGNASSARGVIAFALPIVDRLRGEMGQVVDVRGDAAFATPRFMDALDDRKINYVFRIKSNSRLETLAAPFLKRPVGRPPAERREWLYELTYQALEWKRARRVVLVVVDDPSDRFMGVMHLRHFFLVTTHDATRKSAEQLLEFYRQRGTTETWIGEFKRDVGPRLSSPSLAENQATFGLFALAYQWLHVARTFVDTVEKREQRSTIATFRSRYLKVAAVFVRTARHVLIRTVAHAVAMWSAVCSHLAARAQRIAPVPATESPHPSLGH